jgi:hypothetical protein
MAIIYYFVDKRMFINKEKIKLILMILAFILALGLFSYFLNPKPNEHEDVKPKKEGLDDASGNVTETATAAESTPESTSNPVYNYDSNNYDVNYHDSIKTILNSEDTNPVFGPNLKADGVSLSFPQQPDPTYYTPGSFVFGPSNYVPNYEDSVYLSRTSGLSTVSTAVPSKSVLGGFCASTDKTAIEQKCNSIPVDQCASTSCCVVLGGAKCVSGNELGPAMKSNYTDPTIINKDYYYFQGKCYGFCN